MKQRVLTAIIILAIFIPFLLAGGILFKILILGIALLGLKEMLDARESKYPIPTFIKLLSYLAFIYIVLSTTSTYNLAFLIDYKVISVIILAFSIPVIMFKDNKVYNINDSMFLIGTVLFLGLSFNLIILLRTYSLMTIIYLLLITSMTDTYAYLGGLLIGKHKMIEHISPKKTWEGLVVGTICGVLISNVFYYIAINDSVNIFYLIFVTTLLSLLGQFGDLVFSAIKRFYNKKDFSNLMPGHGGILDRLDSFIFVALGFVLIMFMI